SDNPISGIGTSAWFSGFPTCTSRTAFITRDLISQELWNAGRKSQTNSCFLVFLSDSYFFSAVPGTGDVAAAGKSELNISVATFHLPSAFFFQTSQYLPRSLVFFHCHFVASHQVRHVARFGRFHTRRFPADARQAVEKALPKISNAILADDHRFVWRHHHRVVVIERNRLVEIFRACNFRPLFVGITNHFLICASGE